jgi:hypothetical protein
VVGLLVVPEGVVGLLVVPGGVVGLLVGLLVPMVVPVVAVGFVSATKVPVRALTL